MGFVALPSRKRGENGANMRQRGGREHQVRHIHSGHVAVEVDGFEKLLAARAEQYGLGDFLCGVFHE